MKSTQPSHRVSFRGDVQGLRAVAVIMVVLYHSGLALPGGFVGVDIFFVLSGFVITRLLVNELEQHDRIDLTSFYLRRIRRILPALAVLVAVILPLGLVFGPIGGQEIGIMTALAATAFNANTYLARSSQQYFDGPTELNPLLHTWSLSVEEQFYLFFPAVLLLVWMLALRHGWDPHRSLRMSLGVIALSSFTFSVVLTESLFGIRSVSTPIGDFAAPILAFYSLPTRAWEFAVGALVAMGVAQVVVGRASAALAGIGATAMLAISIMLFDANTPFPGLAAALPVLGTALLLQAGTVDTPIGRALATNWLQRLGDLSYSWYLWHWPIIVFVGAATLGTPLDTPWIRAAAGFAAIGPAALSMALIENPLRFAPTPRRIRTVGLGIACLCVPLAITGVTSVVWTEVRADHLTDFTSSFEDHLDKDEECNTGAPIDRPDSACRFELDGSDRLAILLGDSNAGHLSEGFVAGMHQAGSSAIVATMYGCPFADVVLLKQGIPRSNCEAFVEEATASAVRLRPDVVVLSSASDLIIGASQVELLDPVDGSVASTTTDKTDVYAQGQERTVERLEEAGIEVVLMRTLPRLSDWDPRSCSVLRWLSDPEQCGLGVDATEATEKLNLTADAERRATEAGASVLDLRDRYCVEDHCHTHDAAGAWLFRDANHLTVEASERLTGTFAELLP